MANPTQAQIDKLTTNLSRYDSIINGAFSETVTLDSHTVKSISGYLSELAANTLRGLWATSTTYAIKDIVEESGNWYVCLDPHTSGTFSSDLAAGKWALYQINLSGNLDLSGDLTVSGTVDATTLTGTLSTAAQANITSLGALSSLDVTGNLTVDTNTLIVDSLNKRVGIGTNSFDANWNPNLQINNSNSDGTGGFLISSYKPTIIFKDLSGGNPERKHIWADDDMLHLGSGDTTQNAQVSIDLAGKVFMPNLATSGVDNGTLKYNSTTGEIWVD